MRGWMDVTSPSSLDFYVLISNRSIKCTQVDLFLPESPITNRLFVQKYLIWSHLSDASVVVDSGKVNIMWSNEIVLMHFCPTLTQALFFISSIQLSTCLSFIKAALQLLKHTQHHNLIGFLQKHCNCYSFIE